VLDLILLNKTAISQNIIMVYYQYGDHEVKLIIFTLILKCDVTEI